MGAYKAQAYPREWGWLEGTSPKVFPPLKNSLKLGLWSSHLLRDLSQVVRRTLRDTPVPFYNLTSPLPRKSGSARWAQKWSGLYLGCPVKLLGRLLLQRSGKKKREQKHKLFGPNFLRTFVTLTPGCQGVKKFLPITRAAGNTHTHILAMDESQFESHN